MQSEPIKKRIIKGLIEEIALLGAPQLELVGHAVVELIETKKMVHHGLNTDYQAAGYTVDTFSQDGSVVAEYSVLKNYFADTTKRDKTDPSKEVPPVFQKMFDDIDHALAHGDPAKIYLISSQEEPESFRAKYLKSDHGKKYKDRVEILDGRELAKRIYEFALKDPRDAAFFCEYFPDFGKSLENYEYYGRAPGACENHQSEEAILDAVRKQLAAQSGICVLHGLSGSGKTQAAIDFVRQTVDSIGNYIWLYGEDWKKGTSLSSIKRSRGGSPFNVAGAFNSVPTVLVIDNLEWTVDASTFEELKPGLAAGGVILVTSILNSPGSDYYIPTPAIGFQTALKILGEEGAPTGSTAAKFAAACRFSPLILATTRSMCMQNGLDKEAFYTEVLENPEQLSKEDGSSIMRSLLSRLEPGCLSALVKIADTGSGRHDANFLAKFIGQNYSITLQKLSILQSASAPGLLKVHDLICAAVRGNLSPVPVSDAIEKVIADGLGEMVPSAIREIHLCEEQLEETHRIRGPRKADWLMYALLQTESVVRRELADALHATPICDQCSLAEVLCIVDAKEVHAYAIDASGTEGNERRQDFYKQCAAEYKAAIDAGIRDELKVELLHHRGKALRRTDMLDDALACFQELLTYRSDWHAAHGQIAHLGTQKGATDEMKAAGEASMKWLIDRMQYNISAVPLRVSLAATARLRSYPNVIKAVSSRRDLVVHLSDVIGISALEGLDQFYEAYVSFTSKFGYVHSDVCLSLAESLPELLGVHPKHVDPGQWTSACEALANTASSAVGAGNRELEKRLSASSAMFAIALVQRGIKDPYTARAAMKGFLAAEMPKEALEVFSKLSYEKKDRDHWLLYRKTQALLGAGHFREASISAAQAFDLATKDQSASGMLASYYDLLSKCCEAENDIPTAKKYCEQAIMIAREVKYAETLKARLVKLEALPSSSASTA